MTMGRIVLALVLVAGCASDQPAQKQKSTAQPEGETAGGGVTPEQNDAIDALFRRKAPQLMTCWQEAYDKAEDHKAARKVEGDVTIGLNVAPSGKPSNVRVLKSSLGSPDIENCIVKEVAGWGFPEVSVEVPYMRTVHLGAQF
jgi:outer membrane biosynthesis protein TonB